MTETTLALEPAPVAAPTGRLEVSVVMPAWNEAENIRRIVPRLRRVLEKAGVSYDVAVVVPSLEDPTVAACRELSVRVIAQRDPGYGGALRAGFEEARGEFILTLDADCSHDPSAVLTLLEARGRADVVIASRYVRFGHSQAGWFRNSLSKVLNGFLRTVLSVPVQDMTSGFRLYRRRIFDEVRSWGRDFDALPEILVLAYALGFTVLEVPFHYRPRGAGVSHARVLRFGFRYLRLAGRLWWLRHSYLSADYDQHAFYSRIPLQRWWHRKRYETILDMLEDGPAVLDIGCGSSMVIVALPEAVGLEVGGKKLRYLRQLGRRLAKGELRRLPFRDGQFDQVVCSNVIEHLPEAEVSFAEVRRVLKPGGVLVVGTPDYSTLRWRLLDLVRRQVPSGIAHAHLSRFNEKILTDRLVIADFGVEKSRRILGAELLVKARSGRSQSSPIV